MHAQLLRTLTSCSEELGRAHMRARADGREDIAQEIRRADWKVRAAIDQLAHEMGGNKELS